MQTPAGTTARTPALTLQGDEVSLDLVVHDKKQKAVLDLKPSDIAVTDNGTPVTLSALHLVSGAPDTGHVITLVFDPMQGPAARNAQDIANKIVKMAPKAGFNLAVLSMGSRLRLVQGFTGDSKAIERAIDVATQEGEVQQGIAIAAAEKNLIAVAQTGVSASGQMVDVEERARAKVLLAALEGSQRIVQDQHTVASLAGLLALARSQRQLQVRKAVIYFTLNGQLDSDAREMVNTIMGAANRANVSMYTIDMNGVGAGVHNQLMTMMVMGNIAGQNPIGNLAQGQPGDPAGPGAGTFIANDSTRFEGAGAVQNKSPLAQLAAGTGGAYIDGQDSVKKPLQRMLQDMTTYYQASYVPPVQDYDGSFRAIAVKPLRTGLTIRTKSGYFALPSGGVEGIRPFEAPLLKILSEAELPAELEFNASVLRLGELPDGNTNTLAIEVPISQLEMKQDANTKLYAAHASIIAQIKDSNGKVIERFGEDIPRHGALESMDEAKCEFLTLQRNFIAIPGKYLLEAAVMDRISGKAGAQRIKFEIAEPGSGPLLSDMVLVRKMESYRAEVGSEDPLRYGNGRVTPNLSGQLPEGAKSVGLYFILHPDAKAAEQPSLTMEVLRDGHAAGRTTLPYHPGSGTGAVPYLASLKTSSLSPGLYDVIARREYEAAEGNSSLSPGLYDVIARMTQGSKEVESSIAFTVEGASSAGSALAGTIAASGSAEGLQGAAGKPVNASELMITIPDKALPPPSQAVLQAMIADARVRAVSYSEGLPNFMCLEMTERSVDPSGAGRWKHKDSLVELLRYRDATETRTLLRMDGKSTSRESEGLKGVRSIGEFGGVLNAVFQAASKAKFDWKQTAALGSGTVEVFAYRVAQANSKFKVTGAGDHQISVGFHGQVFIDPATRSVRRITLVADDLPRDFSIHATSISVDYDYVAINAHDYLMPASAEVSLQEGRHAAVLNEIEFRDYRRFGSNARILGFTPVDRQ